MLWIAAISSHNVHSSSKNDENDSSHFCSRKRKCPYNVEYLRLWRSNTVYRHFFNTIQSLSAFFTLLKALGSIKSFFCETLKKNFELRSGYSTCRQGLSLYQTSDFLEHLEPAIDHLEFMVHLFNHRLLLSPEYSMRLLPTNSFGLQLSTWIVLIYLEFLILIFQRDQVDYPPSYLGLPFLSSFSCSCSIEVNFHRNLTLGYHFSRFYHLNHCLRNSISSYFSFLRLVFC